MLDATNIQFSSTFNYLKTYIEGTGSVHFESGTAYSDLETISHGLGYIPAMDVWFIPEGVSDRLVPLFIGGPLSSDVWLIEFNAYHGRIRVDENDLIIEMFRDGMSPGGAVDIPIYYNIYLDEVAP